MRLTVFGATGPSGLLVLEKALAAGHDVTAFVRNPGKLTIKSERLHTVTGQLTNGSSLEVAIAGAGAVISLLGPQGKVVGTPIAEGTLRMVAAMQRHGVKRLIATATPSAADPADGKALSFSLAVAAVRVLAGSASTDIVGTATVVRNSGLDWTLVRLPMLSNAPAPRPAVAGYIGDPRIKLFSLSRAALADFLVGQLSDTTWLQKAPVLSNG